MKLTLKEARLTKEEIFSKISDYDVFKNYIGGFKINRAICSPLRTDKSPSFSVRAGKTGNLYWVDYGADEHGDCISLVERMYGLQYADALMKIAHDMGISNGSNEYKRIIAQYSKPVIDQRRYSFIQANVKAWDKRSLAWWEKYLIAEEDLKRENIYSVSKVFLNRKCIPIGATELVYGYWSAVGWKIMFPERPKDSKWLSNIPLTMLEGMDKLSKEHDTIVVPAKKCRIVVEKVHPWCCNIQNESVGSITDEMAKEITENSRRVFYWGNSDEPGKKASYKITEKYKWLHINTPDPLLPEVTDPSDWSYRTQSLEPIRNHINKKGIR